MTIGRFMAFFLVVAGLAGCQPIDSPLTAGSSTWPSGGTATYTPFQPLPPGVDETTPGPLSTVEAAAGPLAQATSTRLPPTGIPVSQPESVRGLWVHPAVPPALRASLQIPPGFQLLESPDAPAGQVLQVVIGADRPLSRWVYALVTPFPSKIDGVSQEAVRRGWHGAAEGPFAGQPILLAAETLAVFSAWWGEPAAGAVQVISPADLVTTAWERRPVWALVPFEALEPRWKTLPVAGMSPLDKEFSLEAYALAVPVSLIGPEPLLEAALQTAPGLLPSSNRQPDRLTTLALTGVTALVRATAFTMERQGLLYPGQDIRDVLRGADLTHISNEVPFAKNCPYPNPNQQGVVFCSDPRYIALLEDVGADIIELTGDHFHDWGRQAMLDTLDLYKEKGWPYYGGGANLAEGRQALLVEHNGNRLAFIGCNAKGGGFAQASQDNPGSVSCDFPWMEAEITRLRDEGYLPIATFQHHEYYTYNAQPNQEADSRRLAQAGAVIVSGSQAHQPQGMEFWGESFIHYGLGNLFFDQYDISYACRQAFIDVHVFYEGRYLGVQLHPILFIDYARPRPMTAEERDALLESVFRASGW